LWLSNAKVSRVISFSNLLRFFDIVFVTVFDAYTLRLNRFTLVLDFTLFKDFLDAVDAMELRLGKMRSS